MQVEKNNHRVLLVEESATLRYIQMKSLQKHGYEIMVLDSFDSAIDCLQKAQQSYHAVIIGWPNYTDHQSANDLMSLLGLEAHNEIPVILLAHDADLDVLNWMSSRRFSALVPWENYQESVPTLQKLLGSDTEEDVCEANEVPDGSIRVLFVDDSVSIRHYYQRLLKRNGYKVETADSVKSAFEIALKQKFDLAIIDYFMPDENGYILCQKLRDDKRTASIRAAVITGTYLDEVIKDCLQAGAVECMFKNEAEELFLSRIKSMSRFIEIEQKVENERERLAGILESVGEGVYGVDNDACVTFVNPAALKIIGQSDDALVLGKKAVDVFHYDIESNKDHLYRAYGQGTELKCWETIFRHTQKKQVSVECTAYPLTINQQQEGSVIAFRDISDRKMLEEKLQWQATHDHLTQLYNRRYFEDVLDTEVQRVQKEKQISALLYLDLDRFKYINDTAGHEAGDKLLINVAILLKDKLREGDMLARLGGDEFAIILCNIDIEQAIEITEDIRISLDSFGFSYAGKNYNIYGSFGVAILDAECVSAGDVLANADIACHMAKRNGRNQVQLYQKSQDEKNVMGSELGWSKRLRDAINNNDFVLHFQPILDINKINLAELPLADGGIWESYRKDKNNSLHYELLLRMKSKDGGLFYPDEFMPTAERFNLILDIDLWVIKHALIKLAEVLEKRDDVTFSINLSGHTLNTPESLEKIKSLLNQYPVNPEKIIFEVTETLAIYNRLAASQFIDEMKILGCRFSLDDFGSGFCSFSQLKLLAVDFVKIDGQFVKEMARGSTDRAIVTAMNDVAHSLGRYTVAEYVETAEVLRLLKICGVDHAQGAYISMPTAVLDVV